VFGCVFVNSVSMNTRIRIELDISSLFINIITPNCTSFLAPARNGLAKPKGKFPLTHTTYVLSPFNADAIHLITETDVYCLTLTI